MTVAVELESVDFGYEESLVLEDVSFHLDSGSFTSVVGPNGGGKTTLLKLLLGLLAPGRGKVRVFGRRPQDMRHAIGYMPQALTLDRAFPITVQEVVQLGRLSARTWFGLRRAEDREAVTRALRTVGCEHLRQRSFRELSGGQRQLVLIARALVSDPEILLLDEPTANLDPAVEESFFSLLRRLRGKITIVLVSHDVGLVAEQSETVVCVNRVAELHPAHTVSGDLVQSMFGESRARIVQHTHGHVLEAPAPTPDDAGDAPRPGVDRS